MKVYPYFSEKENGLEALQGKGILEIVGQGQTREGEMYTEVYIQGILNRVKWSQEKNCFVVENVPGTRWYPLANHPSVNQYEKIFYIEVRKINNGTYKVFLFEKDGEKEWIKTKKQTVKGLQTKEEVKKVVRGLTNHPDRNIEGVYEFTELPKKQVKSFVCGECEKEGISLMLQSKGKWYFIHADGTVYRENGKKETKKAFMEKFIDCVYGYCEECEDESQEYVSLTAQFEDGTAIEDEERKVLFMMNLK